MATFTKVLLSGSTNGQPIKVVATATVGTTIHATQTSSSIIDEVWLYACNTNTSAVTLTIEYGGVVSPDNKIILSIPAQSGLAIVAPGLVLTGTGAAARNITAFASVANVITVVGYINRIS